MKKALAVIGCLIFVAGALMAASSIYSYSISGSFSSMPAMVWAAAIPVYYGMAALLGAIIAAAALILIAVEKKPGDQ